LVNNLCYEEFGLANCKEKGAFAPLDVPKQEFVVGFQWLRVLAIGLVTWQHAASVTGHEKFTWIGNLSIGQFGVSIFLFISGWLAMDSQRSPTSWLIRRAARIYPAYWIVMLVSFTLAWLVGYKQFSWLQVISQFAGVGFFTHPDNLVNTPTWFVSLLLACYLGTYLVRCLTWPMCLISLVTTSLAFALITSPEPQIAAQASSYWIGSSLSFLTKKAQAFGLLGTSLLLGLMSIFINKQFGYAATATILVTSTLLIRGLPEIVRLASQYSYEYYLLHGIFLTGIVDLVPSLGIYAAFLGISIAALTAIVFGRLLDYLLFGIVSMRRKSVD
jgi:peptidoglycan/LPS O-acetylase OafA/YrhL